MCEYECRIYENIDKFNYMFFVLKFKWKNKFFRLDVKNNSELVVDIDENLHRIFAIIDVYTKDTCVDMIEIPAGNEDVYVSGRNYLSPFKGNPFIFDK